MPPWELAVQPITWREWALQAEQAENQAASAAHGSNSGKQEGE